MVDEVKIENVGGTRPQLGVASEATLQALLDATRGTQRSDRDRQRIQESYDRAVRDSTSRQGIFSKAIKSGAEAVYNFGKELAVGGDRASDFANAIFGSSSMVSKLTRYLDENIDTWRSLSSVGASFNNSILDMISSAANSAMNIDSFTSMVRNNSEALSRFGTTASQGARFLGEFSKDFRAGVGTQFLEMGFTIEDINEGLIGFMDIERMRSTQALRSDREQQEAASQYLLSLDKLTRVTGRQRKQIEDALAQQMQDAGIRSQINRLEGQARSNLQETLAFLDTELQGPLADGLKDLMDGVAQTDLGKALQSQVPGITEFAQRMFRGGASLDEVISELGTNFGPQLARMAGSFSKAQLDQMRMSGGVAGAIAEILDSSYLLNQQVGRDVLAAQEEQRRREPLTSALAKFENAIINIRKAFVDAFFDIVSVPGGLVDAFNELGDFLLGWIEPGANSLTGFVPTLRGWLDVIFGPSGFFTRGVRRFTAWLKEGGLETAWNGLKETFNNVRTWFETFINDVQTDGFIPTIQARFTELTDWLRDQWTNIFTDTGNGQRWQDRIGNYIRDILYGEEVEVQEGPETRTERQGGLIKTISDGFSSLLNRQEIITSITNGFTSIISAAEDAIQKIMGLPTEGSLWQQLWEKVGIDAVGNESILSQLGDKIYDAIFGKLVEIQEGPEISMERQGGILQSISDGFSSLLNRQEIITSITNGFTSIVSAAEDAIQQIMGLPTEGSLWQQLWEKVGIDASTPTIMSQINDKIYDAIFGKLVEIQEGPETTTKRQGGILQSISQGLASLFERQEIIDSISSAITGLFTSASTGFTNFWSGPEGQELKNTIIDFFQELVDKILIAIAPSIPFFDAEASKMRQIERGVARGETLSPELEELRVELITEASRDLARATERLAEANAEIANAQTSEYADTSIVGGWQRQAAEYQATIAASSALLTRLGANQVRGNATGTNGFQNFGSGTLSMLHGTEAVVPRNSPAGEILQSFFDSQKRTGNTAEPRPSLNNSQDQTNLISKIDELNTTMARVAVLMEASVGVQTKTMQNIKGLGTDLYRGIPR